MSEIKIKEVIDEVEDLQNEKKELNNKIKLINEEISELEKQIKRYMNDNDIGLIGTDKAVAEIVVEEYPKLLAADKEIFLKWVIEHGRYEFTPASLNKRPVKAYYEETGELPPGTDLAVVEKLKIKGIKK